jgi:Protein of unknown function (DUF1360)
VSATAAPARTDLPGALGADYAPPGEHRPLAGYGILLGGFAIAFTGALVAATRGGRRLPERLDAQDIVLTAIATHKVSRLLAKDRVTSFVRAPFTEYQESAGHGEVEEAARGRGLRKATGELLVCPYCLGQWVAGAFTVGHVTVPRLTRLLTAMWTAHALADGVQLAYSAAEQRT